MMKNKLSFIPKALIILYFICLTGCTSYPLLTDDIGASSDYNYLIGPGDTLEIFVWDNPDISTTVPVRPDGKVTVPIVEDLVVNGKTPNLVARELEKRYSVFIKDPLVVVMVRSFQGVDAQQIKVIGQLGGSSNLSGISGQSLGSQQLGGGFNGSLGSSGGSNNNALMRYRALAIPYERGMTLLDVMVKIGSIGQYADGDSASVIRSVNGTQKQYRVLLDSLIENADMRANVKMAPGDILIIPEAFF